MVVLDNVKIESSDSVYLISDDIPADGLNDPRTSFVVCLPPKETLTYYSIQRWPSSTWTATIGKHYYKAEDSKELTTRLTEEAIAARSVLVSRTMFPPYAFGGVLVLFIVFLAGGYARQRNWVGIA